MYAQQSTQQNLAARIAAACFFIILLLCTAIPTAAQGGNINNPEGAVSGAMGNYSVTLPGPWAILNNIGALKTDTGGIEVAFSGSNRYRIQSLNTLSLAASGCLYQKYSMGIGVSKFGTNLYSETRLCAGVARQTGMVRLGIAGDYIQNSIQDLATTSTLLLEFGGTVQIGKYIEIGAHAYNITASKLGTDKHSALVPQTLRGGISAHPHKNILLGTEITTTPLYGVALLTGVEYTFLNAISLRAGYNGQVGTLTFGAGIYYKNIRLNYSYGTSALLGPVSCISLHLFMPDKWINAVFK